jgi:hypothetical protein
MCVVRMRRGLQHITQPAMSPGSLTPNRLAENVLDRVAAAGDRWRFATASQVGNALAIRRNDKELGIVNHPRSRPGLTVLVVADIDEHVVEVHTLPAIRKAAEQVIVDGQVVDTLAGVVMNSPIRRE